MDVGAPYGVLLQRGDTFGAQAQNGVRPIEVDQMVLEKVSDKDINLNISFKINNANTFLNSISSPDFRILRRYAMKLKFDNSGNPEGCYTDPQGEIEDAVFRFCQGQGAIYDSEKVLCRIVALTPMKCPVGEVLVGVDFDGSDISDPRVVPRCAGNFAASQNDLSCPNDHILKGINASGEPICRKLTALEFSHLIKPEHLNPNRGSYENCSSGQMKVSIRDGFIEMDCM